MVEDPIFANHLHFLQTHRGHVVRSDQGWLSFAGDIDSLSFEMPIGDQSDCAPSAETDLWVYPWSGDDWSDRLQQRGYVSSFALAYMKMSSIPVAVQEFEIRQVGDPLSALQFAAIQERGFLTEETAEAEWWQRRFKEAALNNYSRPEQRFYTGFWNGEPAGVLLALDTENTTGIYAVATDPRFRMRGVSTALVGKCAAETERELVLQTIVGSYAHGFYERFGFVEQYRMQSWTKNGKKALS